MNMIPCAVPVELVCLSHVEKLLVCRYCPMMRITTLSKGMHVLNGNSIAFHQPLSKLVNVLPHALNDTGLLFVIRGLQSDLEKQRVSAETSENVMSFIYDLAVTGRDWRRRRIHITSFSQFTTHLFFVVKYGGDPRGTLLQISSNGRTCPSPRPLAPCLLCSKGYQFLLE